MRKDRLNFIDKDLGDKLITSVTYTTRSEVFHGGSFLTFRCETEEGCIGIYGHVGRVENVFTEFPNFFINNVSIFLVEHRMEPIRTRGFERFKRFQR